MQKVLLIEDDADIAKNLSYLLSQQGYMVSHVASKKAALESMRESEFSLLIIDVSLPDGNGYSLCTTAKSQYGMPVIFLTASDDEMSVVTGLELGADDYITKPFRPLEMLARIKSVLRRGDESKSIFEVSDLVVDTVRGTVYKAGEEVMLSALEYRLLLVFVNHPNQVLSRDQLLGEIWDIAGDFVNDNTLTVYIKRLRDKIEQNPQAPQIITTVRGLGYRMDA